MNSTRQTNTFAAGMNMDADYSILPNNQYSYAENIRILANTKDSTAAIQNIEGFLPVYSTIPETEKIIHTTTVRTYGIVFTKSEDGKDNVYRYDFTNSSTVPVITKIVNNVDLNITKSAKGVYSISSVCRWEAPDNVKIYWADGHDQLKLLHVDPYHDSTNESITLDKVLIIPKCSLKPFSFQSFGSGNLTAGKIQYCYQLFNAHSAETSISPLSEMIHISKTDLASTSQYVNGSSKESYTGRSIRLSADLTDIHFTRAKIISIYYPSNSTHTMPKISIIGDIEIVGSTLQYEDTGGTVISELTVDEFNQLVSYPFEPEVIESKDNILFAANITEDTWDVPSSYDTRAYRCDSSGNVLLKSLSGQGDISFNINDIESTSILKEHDCVCPYNQDRSSNYKYTREGNVCGGSGVNIDYELVVSNLIEDEGIANTLGLTEDFRFSCSKWHMNTLPIVRITGNNRSIIDNIPLNTSPSIINYSNAEIDAKLRGYQRDEIYRFGIVFYNKNSIPSPVHWIADIRMPRCSDSGFNAFSSSFKITVDGAVMNTPLSVVTHPLGVRFKVKNIPAGVTGYEIVRCERTVADRSILAQGIVSQVLQHEDENNTLVAMPYLSYTTTHGLVSCTSKYKYGWQFSDYIADGHYMFVSPEICFNKDNITEVLDRVTGIDSVGRLFSQFRSTIGDGDFKNDSITPMGDREKPLANAKAIKQDGKTVVDVDSLDYNVNNGWAYTSVSVFNTNDTSFTTIKNAIRMDGGDFYGATLAKYYQYESLSASPVEIEYIKLAEDAEPFDLVDEKWRAKGVNVGDKSYYNWMWDSFDTNVKEDANNLRKQGPHGPCAIFNAPEMRNTIPYIGSSVETIPTPGRCNGVALCNITQAVTPYGGYTYAARQNSVYISTGSYKPTNTTSSNYYSNVYGGDTYIGLMDYANGMFAFAIDDYNYNSTNRIYNGAYFPCESTINLSMRGSSQSTSDTYLNSGYSNHFAQTNVTTIGNLYSQSEPLYNYNDAYSANSTVRKFVAKGIYTKDNQVNDNRVFASQVKTNNEVFDSWTKFKVANYIDVNSQYGPINELLNFNNRLFFWQRDAFGVLSINDRSLITDNNIGALTLGTGGVLTRFDYVTVTNGLADNQNRAVNNSESTIYWLDSLRREICAFNNSNNALSKLKSVQSYLNSDANLILNDPITEYDKKYNEVLFTIKDKALVFNEQLGAFTSFYNYRPDYYFHFSENLYLFNSNNLFKYNEGDTRNLVKDTDKLSIIVFAVNKDYPQTKTFDNVEYAGDFTYGTNFDNLLFNTKRQMCVLKSEGIDYREDTYKFAIPRNEIPFSEENMSYKDRMKGKYLVCRYTYDCNNGNQFKVPYISTAYRHSLI